MLGHYNFLLVSPKNGDAFKIRAEIEKNRLYHVEMVETAQSSMRRMEQGRIHCLIFNLDTFNMSKMSLVTDLRDLGFEFSVMVFATFIQKEAMEAIKRIPRTVVIEKPFESKDAWGIAEKLVQGKKVSQRIFRRFYTNQSATVEKTSNGETLNGQIFNLSRGGAYVELSSGRVVAGDLIKVTVHLDKISRAYNVDAQVVWASPKGYWQGRPAAGLRFVKASDVYRNLLDKL